MRWNGVVLPCGRYKIGGMSRHVTEDECWCEKGERFSRRIYFLILGLKTFSFQNSSENHEEAISSPIAFEISSNASKFAAFSAIRSLVLEHETKYNTINKLKSLEHQTRSKSEDESSECKIIDALIRNESKINVPYVSYFKWRKVSSFLT